MPELLINIPVHQIASVINSMNEGEMETLLLLLSDDGKELLKRTKELKEKKLKFLSMDEVFDV